MEVSEAKQKALFERRFECQNCGICCSHKGRIQPSEKNLRSLATHLQVSEWSFAIRYLQEIYDPKMDAYILAFRTNNPHDSSNGCIFHFSRFCAVYESCRTDLCQVFPWNHFDTEAGHWMPDFVNNEGKFWCRGVGHGREWPPEEIAAQKVLYSNLGLGLPRHANK